jgi:hypothetical protein
MFRYRLLKEFSRDVNNRPVLFEGHYVDPFIIAADMLLGFDVADLHKEPPRYINSNGERYICEPASGNFYTAMYEHCVAKFGNDIYPLPIIVSSDGVDVNKSASRSAKPVYISIASKKGKNYYKDNIRCVGFAPTLQVMI